MADFWTFRFPLYDFMCLNLAFRCQIFQGIPLETVVWSGTLNGFYCICSGALYLADDSEANHSTAIRLHS